jgi:hypothetical protein
MVPDQIGVPRDPWDMGVCLDIDGSLRPQFLAMALFMRINSCLLCAQHQRNIKKFAALLCTIS